MAIVLEASQFKPFQLPGAKPQRTPTVGLESPHLRSSAVPETYYNAIRSAESGGDDHAQNPLSSATGRYQFTGGTWRDLAGKYPQLQLTADGRFDPDQQERAIRAFTADNASVLRSSGLSIDGGTLYASHFLGSGDAVPALKAADATPMTQLVSSQVIQANPFLADMSAGEFRSWAARKGGAGGVAPGGNSTASTAGKIVVDDKFVLHDPMGLYRGGTNPFAVAPPAEAAPPVAPPAAQDPTNRYLEGMQRDLEVQAPGRYQLIDESGYDAWRSDWEKRNMSGDLLGDAWRLLGAGQMGLELAVREAVNQIPTIGPGLVAAGDLIDQWMYGAPTDERAATLMEKDHATLTPETAAARQKPWWDGEKGRLGDAWLDPRSYFAGVVESLPATVVTMAPAMVLARGAYLGVLAKGGGEKAAAAAAARTALISGAILEGGLGGGTTAVSVREQIAQIPRERMLETGAVQALIAEGMSEDDAITAISDDAATQAFVIGGVATGIFGGVGDRMLAKIVAEGVGGNLGQRILAGVVRGTVAEGALEEMPQEAGAQVAENIALGNTVDPGRDPMTGVPNAALGGLAVGATMGATLGGAGAALSPSDVAAQPQDDTTISPTPVPAQEKKGPLARAAEYGVSKVLESSNPAQVFTIVDPGLGAVERGAYDGQQVRLSPDQSGVPQNMKRVVFPDGQQTLMGIGLLMPNGTAVPEEEEAGTDSNAIPTSVTTTTPAPADMKTYAGRPAPGHRAIVEAPGMERFVARVDSYEDGPDGTEALVVNDDGEVLQIPAGYLRTAGLTQQMIEEQERAENPPVQREAPETDDRTRRVVAGATMVMPDATLAQLYDLGNERKLNKRSSAPAAEAKVIEPVAAMIADQLGVLPETVGQIADDYRYRVDRAAKGAASGLPIKMHGLNADRLKGWQAERKRADAKALGQDDAPNSPESPDSSTGTEKTPVGLIDTAANEAATSPTNDRPEPTPAQQEAGNYAKGHVRVGGLDLSIENPAGSERKGRNAAGTEWSMTMKSHYGYIRGTVGRDKDHVDIFVQKATPTDLGDDMPVFVVDQVRPDGSFDEHKVMLGYSELPQARRAYLANYTKGWKGLGDITSTTLGEFKAWLASGNTSTPYAAIGVSDATTAPKPAKAPPKYAEIIPDDDVPVPEGISPVAAAPKAKEPLVKPSIAELEAYAQGVVGPGVLSVSLVGSVAERGEGRDIDLLYDLGDHDLPARDAGEAIEALLSETRIDIERFDTFLKAGPRYFVVKWGAGADIVENTDYAEEQSGRPVRELATWEAPTDQDNETVTLQLTPKGPWDFNDTYPEPDMEQVRRLDAEGRSMWEERNEDGSIDPAQVAATLDEAIQELQVRHLDIAGQRRDIEDIRSGKVKVRGGKTDAKLKALAGSIADDERAVEDLGAAHLDVFSQAAVDALLAEGKRRADIEARLTDPAVERPRIPKEDRGPEPESQKARKAERQKAAKNITENIPAAATPAEWGAANTLVTRDRAEELRQRLRDKLKNQLPSGIDPEILAMGAELAAFHIEAGARRFAEFARTVSRELGTSIESLRPFLRAWYNGARDLMEDSGLDISGTDNADAVREELAKLKDADGTQELDRAGPPALERAPAEALPGAGGSGNAEPVVEGSGGADIPRDQRARGRRVPAGRGVPDGAGTVPVAAGEGDARGPGDVAVARNAEGDEGRSARDDHPVDLPASASTSAQQRQIDYVLSDDDELGAGGAKTKFRQNVAAIEVLRTLERENCPATRDEQSVLAKWVGWGGLRTAFAREDGSVAKGWEKQASELKALLTAEEMRAAEASTLNAHYTSPEVVEAIWSIARRLGFKGGTVLEPSVGAGNFLGLMPGDLRAGSRITGVELDRITGGIAKNLYPAAAIHAPVGFQDFVVPDGYFDLAVGNPPFGSERLYDRDRRNLNKFSIHNFFFAKAIDGLKPNGVLVMVVTNYFLDAIAPEARRYVAEQADLVGAIRLPNNAFLKNAGTEVTTDIIVLRKRPPGEAPGSNDWLGTSPYASQSGTGPELVTLNRYFHLHPDMMLGNFGAFGTMYRANEAALVAREGQDLAADLAKAISTLPTDIMDAPGAPVVPETVVIASGVAETMVGSMFLTPEGAVLVRRPDSVGETRADTVEFPNEKARERVAGMIRVRDVFARLRRAQIDQGSTDKQLDTLRERLNKAYDTFVAKNGPINAEANKRLFRDDPTWPQISALEDKFDKGVSDTVAARTGESARGASAQKASIFSKRTQSPYQRPTSATSAKDALAAVLGDIGRVDLEAMSRLYGKSPTTIVAELGPLLFKTPTGAYETADAYLSGNVKAKLAEVLRAAEQDIDFRRNVEALRDVIPADIEPVDIDVKPGVPWVPKQYVTEFIDLIADRKGGKAVFSRHNARWIIEVPSPTEAATTQWGTDRATVETILEAVMNGQTIAIRDRIDESTSVLNQSATDAANEKAERMKAEWRRWIWEEDERREILARIYNDTFNTDVQRVFDGSHLRFPGKVGDDIITLRPHQANAVWRDLQSSTVLLDHVVGAGKTFTMVAAIMEKRRMGLANKPMLTVPNHLVGQWAADFVKLYPGAKVLATTKADFEKSNRKRLFARIATGDWDVVIVAHSSFGKIGVALDIEQRFIEDQIRDMEASVTELREALGEKSRNVAQMVKARAVMEAKLQRLLDAGAKDDGLTFDELGVDALYVDEAHEFKNLGFATSMTRVAGLGNTQGSQKAADLYMKSQWLLEQTGGKNLTFATGTPLSNTMAEMFTMQRYLDAKGLRDLGLAHFDAWARVFGEIVTDWELSPSGQYRLNSRFSKFVNMPELMQRYLSFADVITNDDIRAQLAALGKTLPLPKVKGGKPQNVVVERSPDQAAYIGTAQTMSDGSLLFPPGSLVYRAENLPKKVEKGSDNMLKVMSDARKAALDMRLIDPGYADVPGSKVHIAADNIKRIYDRWHRRLGTQLVFIDLSTPKKAQAKEQRRILDLMKLAAEGDEAAMEIVDNMSPDEFLALDGKFSVYDDLREKLIARGIPPAEIAFIHDANTEAQKEELFGKVRSGRIRVLFGSTAKMGAGTNVQNKLVALHHLDAPWRPSDLEQRDGRGVRQGNELYAEDPDGFELEILRYATKNTLDARQWQTIEGKARFIAQVRKGDMKAREIEDIAGETANAAEMKAAASGNPLILEEMDLRQKVRRLEGAESEHDREQHRIKVRTRQLRQEAERIGAEAELVAGDAAKAAEADGDTFAATIEGQAMEKPTDMGAAIVAAGRRMLEDGPEKLDLGTYGPFKVAIEHSHTKQFDVVITGNDDYEVGIADIEEVSAQGLAMRILNAVRKLKEEPERAAARVAEIEKQLPALERQLAPWTDAPQLEQMKARHREVLAELQPKKPGAPAAEPKASISDEPVVRLTGDELGMTFTGAKDMPALRKAALKWYETNLRGTIVNMGDGTPVIFGQRGRNKTVAGKGDVILRYVPAIADIIRSGRIVLREPGRQQGVVERIVITAPVALDGVTRSMAVSVFKQDDGQFHYDLTFDTDAPGSPGVGVPGGPAAKLSRRSAVDGAPGGLNIVEWAPEGKYGKETVASKGKVRFGGTHTEASLLAELKEGPFGAIVDQLIAGDRLEIVDYLSDYPQTGGLTWPGGQITLLANNIRIGEASSLLLHEAFHSGGKPLLGSAKWQQLLDRLDQLHRQFSSSKGSARAFFDKAVDRIANAERIQGPMSRELTAEELGAYAIEEYELAPAAMRRWVDDVVGAIKAWLYRRFGRQIGQITPAQLRALATTALRAAPGTASPGMASVAEADPQSLRSRFSITAPKVLGGVKETVRGKLIDIQPAMLKTVPLNYFTELARSNMSAVAEYLRTKRAMDAYRGKKHAEADTVAQEWLKFSRLGKVHAAALASLMHDATLAGADPGKTDDETRALPGYAELRKRLMALPASGRELFVKVRDTYAAQSAELDKLLLDNMHKAQKIASQRADERYEAEIRRLETARMAEPERRKAVEQAQDAHANAKMKSSWAMKGRMTKMRLVFERTRAATPYFPLARFGRYFVVVRDVDGTVLSFSRREGATDRDRLARDMRQAFPAAKVEVGVLDQSGGGLRDSMDPRLLAEIEGILSGAGVDSSVLDAVWQRYLQSMPDLSTRKRFIHRKGTAGFDQDALRAFSSHLFHAAHQMGRLKYGIDMQEMLHQAGEQARKSDDPTKGVTLVNELGDRHKWIMNPTGNSMVQAVTSAMFVWYLGMTPAAAIVNLTQTPMLGIPILGARYGGAKATAALMKAAKDFVAGGGSAAKAKLKPDEVVAIERFYESGLIDRTQSHDLAGVGETGVEYSPLRAKIMAKISWMFHKAEVANREVTALAAFRLARDSGIGGVAAIEAAHELVWRIHFDYSNSSRPPIMQGDVAKLLLVFKNYQLNMWYRLFRDIHQSFKGATPQARKEARYQLAGIMGMLSLLGGVTGFFGYNVLMAIAGMFLGDDDDPFSFDQQMRRHVLDLFGPAIGGMILNGVPGHLLGIDMTSRIGMPDLFLRAPETSAEGKDWFKEFIFEMAGVVPATIANGFDSFQLLQEGNVFKAVEVSAPKFIKDAMQAYRIANEGLVSRSGNEIIPQDQITAWDSIAEVLGFTSAKVAETYDRNSALYDADQVIRDMRSTLMNQFAMAVAQGDDEARTAVIERIKAFNAKPTHRGYRISGESLQRSLATRKRNADKREDGVLIQSVLGGRDLRELLPDRVY